MCEKLPLLTETAAEAGYREACKHAFTMLNVAEHRITIVLLAFELLSLVQSIMIQIGEFFKGVLCIAGQSQSGKTLVSSMYFDFEKGCRTDINFDSTLTAIIRTIANKRDAVATVDDYKPTSIRVAANTQMLTLDKIIRMCADDSHGYQKAGSGNSTVAIIANGLVAITAEEIRLQVQSTLARLLIVEMNRKSMNWKVFTECRANHDAYKTFLVNYILHISKQGVRDYCINLAERFLRERHVLRNKLLEKDIIADNRTSDQCTWLHISFDEFLKYALEVGTIDQEQFEGYKEESLEIFLSLMQEQAERIGELDDVTRFFKGLRNLLDTQEDRLAELQDRNLSYASIDSKSAIGFSKKGYVYLKNDVAFLKVATYFRRLGKDFVMSESALRKMLNNNGYLVRNPQTPKSPIHRLFVNHESYQCIKFEEATFYKLLKGGKNNGAGSDSEIPGDWGARQNADNLLGRGN